MGLQVGNDKKLRYASLKIQRLADRIWNIVRFRGRLQISDHHIHKSSSPGVVVANTHSAGASLLVWLTSGLLAWTGASSFAELGSAIPQNGGAQAYLAYAYGPLVSYLFAWTAIIALKPGELSNTRVLLVVDFLQVEMR